jgi:hypothetical protein
MGEWIALVLPDKIADGPTRRLLSAVRIASDMFRVVPHGSSTVFPSSG